MKAPPGRQVSIYYDGRSLEPGDALQTPTGRLYLVTSVRVQTRGAHVGRQHLAAVVVEPPIPDGVRVVPLFWYRRGTTRPSVAAVRAARSS